jgi:phosphoesterase RecJ-like protein
VNVNQILEETYYRKSYNQMLVTAQIQSRSVLTINGKCIYGYCTEDMMKEYGVTVNDLDAVISTIRNVEGVEVAMFIYQLDKESFKVSLRSKREVDVSKIAVEFGGGGHVRAAGFDIQGQLEQIIEQLLERLKKELI